MNIQKTVSQSLIEKRKIISEMQIELSKREKLITTRNLKDKDKPKESAELDIMYSICSEFFIERANFKGIMFTKHADDMKQYGSFSPNIYFTNEFEFGAF